jgi:hypothetical protein
MRSVGAQTHTSALHCIALPAESMGLSRQVLLAYPDMECYVGHHVFTMVVAALGLLIYCFGCEVFRRRMTDIVLFNRAGVYLPYVSFVD